LGNHRLPAPNSLPGRADPDRLVRPGASSLAALHARVDRRPLADTREVVVVRDGPRTLPKPTHPDPVPPGHPPQICLGAPRQRLEIYKVRWHFFNISTPRDQRSDYLIAEHNSVTPIAVAFLANEPVSH